MNRLWEEFWCHPILWVTMWAEFFSHCDSHCDSHCEKIVRKLWVEMNTLNKLTLWIFDLPKMKAKTSLFSYEGFTFCIMRLVFLKAIALIMGFEKKKVLWVLYFEYFDLWVKYKQEKFPNKRKSSPQRSPWTLLKPNCFLHLKIALPYAIQGLKWFKFFCWT